MKKINQTSSLTNQKAVAACKAPKGRRLLLEMLESRELLNVGPVSGAADELDASVAFGSASALVAAAAETTTIDLSSLTAPELSNGELDVRSVADEAASTIITTTSTSSIRPTG